MNFPRHFPVLLDRSENFQVAPFLGHSLRCFQQHRAQVGLPLEQFALQSSCPVPGRPEALVENVIQIRAKSIRRGHFPAGDSRLIDRRLVRRGVRYSVLDRSSQLRQSRIRRRLTPHDLISSRIADEIRLRSAVISENGATEGKFDAVSKIAASSPLIGFAAFGIDETILLAALDTGTPGRANVPSGSTAPHKARSCVLAASLAPCSVVLRLAPTSSGAAPVPIPDAAFCASVVALATAAS